MKKPTFAGIVSIIALVFAPSSAALAVETPAQSVWVEITPCEGACLETTTYDPETGLQISSFVDETETNYQMISDLAEVDPINNIAYFAAAGELYRYDLSTTGDSRLVAELSDLPSSNPDFRGLAIDDASGKLFVLWYDGDASHYYLNEFDTETETFIVEGLELDDYLITNDAYDIAIAGDYLYTLTSGDAIVVLDLASGESVAEIAYPFNSYIANAIDTDADGNLRVALLNEDDDYDSHVFVYDGSWSDEVDLSDNLAGLAWWEIADVNGEEALADTGIDASIPLAAGAALVAAGVVTLRRRARR